VPTATKQIFIKKIDDFVFKTGLHLQWVVEMAVKSIVKGVLYECR
jgi:hypothetical protein